MAEILKIRNSYSRNFGLFFTFYKKRLNITIHFWKYTWMIGW